VVHACGCVFITFRKRLNIFFFQTLGLAEASFVILSVNIGKGGFPSVGDREFNMSCILESDFDWRRTVWEWCAANSINQNWVSAWASGWSIRWLRGGFRRRVCRWTFTGVCRRTFGRVCRRISTGVITRRFSRVSTGVITRRFTGVITRRSSGSCRRTCTRGCRRTCGRCRRRRGAGVGALRRNVRWRATGVVASTGGLTRRCTRGITRRSGRTFTGRFRGFSGWRCTRRLRRRS